MSSTAYTPSQVVVAAHRIPHVYATSGKMYTGGFNLTNLQFNPTIPTATTGWLPTVFPVPIALLVLGIVSILLMNVFWFFRCFSCCRFLKCAPTEETIETDPLKVVKSRKFIWYWFLFWLLVVVLADHALYFGNADVDKAIDQGAASFGTLGGIFQDVLDSVIDISLQLVKFNTAILAANAQCQSSMSSATSALTSPISTVTDLVSSLPGKVKPLQNYLGQDAKDYKNRVAFVFYAVIMAVALAFPLAAYFLRSKCAFYLIMTFTWLIVVALTVICAIVMIFVMIFSDFCMDPVASLLTFISATSSQGQMITYYTSCVGNSPFSSSLQTISAR